MKLQQLFFIAILSVTTSSIVQASQQVVQPQRLRITWEEHQELCNCLEVEILIHYVGAEALSPKYSSGNWLLVRAAEGEKIEVVRLLLEAGAIPTYENGYGHTFFDLVKQKPGIKKVYEDFLQLQACKKEA